MTNDPSLSSSNKHNQVLAPFFPVLTDPTTASQLLSNGNLSEALSDIPEIKIPEYKMSDFARIEDGAQLIEIGKDGKETLKAIYDVDFGRFVPIE